MASLKWKNALTPEEAALLAIGQGSYETLKGLEKKVDYLRKEFENLTYTLGDLHDGYVNPARTEAEFDEIYDLYTDALGIYNALIDEIFLADPHCPLENSELLTELVIAKRAQTSDVDFSIVPETSTVTKDSLARWFYQHDINIAKIFDPSIEEKIKAKPLKNSVLVDKNIVSEPSTKTINFYLKTIKALSEALVGKSTGMPNKDAEVILAALADKGIEAPVVAKTLAKYLDDASDL